jgi:hypothetical protein
MTSFADPDLEMTPADPDPALIIISRVVEYTSSPFFYFIMYSRKVQKKYNADTKLQERSQEKHMVVWL